jgi:hypothetical protein
MNNEQLRINREIVNEWSMYGAESLVRKLGEKWILADKCKHPGLYETKQEAKKAVTNLALALELPRP